MPSDCKRSSAEVAVAFCVLAECLVVSSAALATPTQWLLPLTGAVTRYDASGHNAAKAGFTNATANWDFFQWQNPVSLPAQQFSPGTTWNTANSWSRIQYYSSLGAHTNVYEFGSANIPCATGGLSQDAEQDLFLQTKSGTVSVSMSSVGQLLLTVGLSVPYATYANTCAHNFSGYIAAWVLTSTTGQTLYMQTTLGGVNNSSGGLSWCPDFEQHNDPQDDASHGTAFSGAYCLDMPIQSLGGTWVNTYQDVQNSVDIFPKTLQIIRSGHQKTCVATGACAPLASATIDSDPSHWTVRGIYFGQASYGGEIATTRWYNLGLLSRNGGSFCASGSIVQWSCDGNPGSGWVNVGGGCYHRASQVPCQ